MTAGRDIPYAEGAEESIIGACLLSNDAIKVLMSTLLPADFFKPQHQHIVSAIYDLVDDGDPVDVVTVGEQLRQDGTLDDAGGREYLGTLQNATPSISAASHYAELVADAAKARRILHAAADMTDAVYDGDQAGIIKAAARLDVAVTAAVTDTGWDFEPLDATGLTGTTVPDILNRTDGEMLAYRGKMLYFQGEPGSGKSMIAGALISQVVAEGGTVTILDFEDAKSTWHERLVAMDADPATLAAQVTYHRFLNETPEDYVTKVLRIAPTVAIIDSTGRAVRSTTGPKGDALDDDKGADWNEWRSRVVDPLLAAGITVALIDHVVKSKDDRGRYAKGSGMKLSDVDGVTYTVKTVSPFNRTTDGAFKLIVAKDRPGALCATEGQVAAYVKVKSSQEVHATGDIIQRLAVYIDPPKETTTADTDTDTDGADAHRRQTMSKKLDAILAKDLELSTKKIEKKLAADLVTELGDIGAAIKFSKVKNGPLDILLEERRAAGTIIDRDLGTNNAGISRGVMWSLPPAQQTLPETTAEGSP